MDAGAGVFLVNDEGRHVLFGVAVDAHRSCEKEDKGQRYIYSQVPGEREGRDRCSQISASTRPMWRDSSAPSRRSSSPEEDRRLWRTSRIKLFRELFRTLSEKGNALGYSAKIVDIFDCLCDLKVV